MWRVRPRWSPTPGPPTQAEYAERAELARAELASALGSAPSPEAEARAKALLERLDGAAHNPQTAA
ncbi:hypothetical protein [Streptomyces sp. IBSBF 3136]|uniref:hypothetical protein n=1 Tax=Streptomyces sp. IBSBF 3136 TaxID=2903524 RepID=UPI002FDB9E7C